MIIEVSKGYQISIPAKIRKKHEWQPGTKLELEETKQGLIIKPVSEETWDALFAEGKKYRCDLTVEELNELFYREIHRR